MPLPMPGYGILPITETERAKQQLNPFSFDFLTKPTQGIFSITGPVDENLIFWLILLKASKTEAGMNRVLDILKTMILQTAEVLGDVARSGAANEIQAWSSGRLISLWMERYGQITQSQAVDYIKGLNLLVGIGTVEGLVQTLTGAAKDFPANVNLGAKINGGGDIAKAAGAVASVLPMV